MSVARTWSLLCIVDIFFEALLRRGWDWLPWMDVDMLYYMVTNSRSKYSYQLMYTVLVLANLRMPSWPPYLP